MDNMELLAEVRKTARKMHKTYLESVGLLDWIMSETSGDEFHKFKMKERIDFILNGSQKRYCYCGKLCIGLQKYCSVQCNTRSDETRSRVSSGQLANAETRMANTRKTLMDRYGVDHISKIPSVLVKIKEAKQAYFDKGKVDILVKYGVSVEDGMNLEWCQDKFDRCASWSEISDQFFGGMPITTLARHMRGVGMTSSYSKTSSSGERELATYIESLGFEVDRNNRILCKPKELDMVVHEKKIAIEYDGLYWHAGEAMVESTKSKNESANSSGYQIIHVFEDEWLEKREIVKSVIASKLGIYDHKIYARKCDVRKVSQNDARIFLERCHLQGNAIGSNYGLYHNGVLISLASVVKSRFSKTHKYELLRYATELHTIVVGGFGKLLSHIKKLYPDPILTYCDKRYSVGKTYEKFGTYLRDTPPGYFWTKGLKRISRHSTQKHKLAKLLGDGYDPNKTEVENMEESRYSKIFDRGNYVFEL